MLNRTFCTGLFLLFIIFNTAFGQNNCQIIYSGIILDKHDKQPVPFARVVIKEVNKYVLSDSIGKFSFTNLCQGVYNLSCFHHVGCEPVKIEKHLKQNTFDTLYIEFHFQELEETQVTHTVIEMSTLPVVKPSELDKKFALGKPLGELLKTIPGVNSLNTGNSISKPVIHGMHSNRILTVNNEIRQEGQQWGSEHAPEIDPFLSTEVALIKGANSIKYGSDAIGGVIQVSPSELKYQEKISGKLQTALFSNGKSGSMSGYVEGGIPRLKNFAFRLQGTYKQGGTLNTPSYFLKNTAMKEYNFSWNGKYSFKKWEIETFYSQFNTDIAIFSGAHIGNLTDLKNAFSAKEPLEEGSFTYKINRPNQHIEHELFKVKNSFKFSDKHILKLIYGRQFNQREEFDIHSKQTNSQGKSLPSFQFTLTTQTIDFSYEHSFTKNLNGEIGLQTMHQNNTQSGRFFIPNFQKNAIGLYWFEKYKYKKNEFELGIRADYLNMNVYLNKNELIEKFNHTFDKVSSILGHAYKFNHHCVLRSSIATAWRAPSINELYSNGLHHGSATIEVGRTDLKIEQSLSFQSGFTYKSNRFSADLDLYHNELDGFIYLKPSMQTELTIKGAFPVFTYDQIKASFSGVDLFLQYKLNKNVDLKVKGSLVRAFDKSNHNYIVGIPADRIEPSLTYNATFKKNQKITVSLSALKVAKQTRFEPNSDYVDPPKGYYLLNSQLTYSFRIKKQFFDISIEASNITNVVYRDYLNRFRYFADEIGRNFGLKITLPIN